MALSIFRRHIRSALADPTLQAALDANAERRIQARKAAFASLPEDLQVLRQRAHAMRADVIANLDHYLDQFVANTQSHGMVIHRAAGAEEAVKIVLDIARQKEAHLIAKSKTMVSEEIGLNRTLLDVGIQPVETDLGEYIVQLRGEHPAHIITPAVHLRREQVGETFHEKLGIPLTDDIPTLTNVARATLRQTFLDADIGVSGVNMGVAETGTLCIVTNEGNGRMVTTLPGVHIALMGIERLVPDLDSLALILALLPRSATGQKMSVYTQLIHGPRRPPETDGAEERHVVLVDNGRSKLSNSPLADILMCIRCGACLNACPVFREIGGHAYVGRGGQFTPYTGPMGSVVSPGLFGQTDFGHLAQASTLCGACKEACPVDIDIPSLLLRVRAGQGADPVDSSAATLPQGLPRILGWGLRLFTWGTTSPRRFAATQKLAAACGWLWSPRRSFDSAQGRLWMHLPAFTGWGYSKDFPQPARKPFRKRWKERVIRNKVISRQEAGEEGSKGAGVRESRDTTPSLQANFLEDTDPTSLVDQFQSELTKLNGVFTACTEAELPRQILDLLREHGVNEIMSWEAEHLPAGLVEELQWAGINLVHESHPEIRIGLTGVLAASAETGTLILASGAGRPLSTSLLPETHIAILREKDIYENLPQVLGLQEIREVSSVTLISGPSRTADIEMALTIGVHGPGELYVFCLR